MQGDRKLKTEKCLPYKLKTDRFADVNDVHIGLLTLEKPSNLLDDVVSKVTVCYCIVAKDDAFSLKILREVRHPNVLHMESVIRTSGDSVEICVENYNESLFHQVCANFESTLGYPPGAPSRNIQGFVSQLVEGIEAIRLYGLYHGNIRVGNTYFDRSYDLVKLANFQKKGEGEDEDEDQLRRFQLEDWNDLGNVTQQFSLLRQTKGHPVDPVLQDLTTLLTGIAEPRLPATVKDLVMRHVFFWDKHRRTTFFVYDIIPFFQNPAFIGAVNTLNCIPNHWNTLAYGGILIAMDTYRGTMGLHPYQAGNLNFVQFVSGAYTHEEEMKATGALDSRVNVDHEITSSAPELCFRLVHIVRSIGGLVL